MRWDAFQAAYPRPQIIFADGDGDRSQARFDLLRRLVQATRLTGSWALYPEDGLIRVVFEHEADAAKLAAALHAHRSPREGGWAGQWAFIYDNRAEEAIKAQLPRTAPRHPSVRAGGKLRRRALPV